MPRKRKDENKGLPARWVLHHGAYYYQVPPGLESHWDGKRKFLLGRTLPVAYKVWTERVVLEAQEIRTVAQLLDRYALEVVPEKAPSTRADNLRAILRLKKVFGELTLDVIKPKHIYAYVDRRKTKTTDGKTRKAPTAAHREIEVLSHAYTKAIRWGLIDRHPWRSEIELDPIERTTRYLEDWEVDEIMSLKPQRDKRDSTRMILAYLRVKLLTGLSRGDLLRLGPAQFGDEGIQVMRHKTATTTGKTTIYRWSPALRAAVDDALAARPVQISPFLFCTERGVGYMNEATGKPPGFKSSFQRFVARVLKETKVERSFSEKDFRTKVASDAETLERGQELLQHASSETTQKYYRLRPERVNPAR